MSSSRISRLVAGFFFVAVSSVRGQMPASPVLQNAWASPGIIVAANLAGGASRGSTYAGAVAWAPSSSRFQLSAGAGVNSPKGGSSRGVYGARLAFPVMQMMSGKLGIAGFAGFGGGSTKPTDLTSSRTVVPAGVAVGYRQAIGSAGRGFSVYADPSYQYHSAKAGSKSFFRVGLGVDAGITARLGVTVGVESGSGAKAGEVGPRGSSYGVGLSMKLGR